jgi:CheY-like chemotaxis protein
MRYSMRDRVLVIDDATDSRKRTVALLGEAGYVPFEQPSAIGATRRLLSHSIAAVVIDLGMPGLSGEKLIALLRKNPRLDGLVIVVVPSLDGSHQASHQGLRDADAVVLREQLDHRLVSTLERLLCTSGFHQKAQNLAELAANTSG